MIEMPSGVADSAKASALISKAFGETGVLQGSFICSQLVKTICMGKMATMVVLLSLRWRAS